MEMLAQVGAAAINDVDYQDYFWAVKEGTRFNLKSLTSDQNALPNLTVIRVWCLNAQVISGAKTSPNAKSLMDSSSELMK